MFKLHLKRTLFFGILGLAVALAIARFSPPVYEGRTGLIVGEEQNAGGLETLSADVASILRAGRAGGVETELGVLASEGVFFEALDTVRQAGGQDLTKDWQKYYLMYNVAGTERSSVARISVKTNDPKSAADIANAITQVYNRKSLDRAKASTSRAIEYLEGQLTQAETDLKKAEDDYKKGKEALGTEDIATEMQSEQAYLATTEQHLDTAKGNLAATEAELAIMKSQLDVMPTTTKETSTLQKNPVISQLEAKIADLEGSRASLVAARYEDWYEVKILDATLASLRKDLAEYKKNYYSDAGNTSAPNPERRQLESLYHNLLSSKASLDATIASLTADEARQKQKITTLPQKEITLTDLERNKSIFDGKYRTIKVQLEALKNRTGVSAREAQVLYQAVPDPVPVAPEPLKLSFAGVLAGLCLGLVFSFGVEAMRLRAHTSSQLAEYTGLPVVATVPSLPRPQMARIARRLAQGNGQPAESFRFMAFAMLQNEASLPKTVVFTSTGNVAGASTSCLQFALAVASTGTRVLLIDANFQRGTLTELLGNANKGGLSDLLSKALLPAGHSELIVSTQHANLEFLPVGTTPETGFSTVATAQLDSLFQSLKGKADVIIIDTAACDAVADASRIAKHADEVCLVVSARSTNFRNIPLAYEILHRSGANSVSLVLVDASVEDEPFSDYGPYLAKVSN